MGKNSPYVLLVKLVKEYSGYGFSIWRFSCLVAKFSKIMSLTATKMTWHSPRPFLSFSSQDKSWCESYKRSSHNFMENKKLTFDTKIRCLMGPGFREISSRENDQWNLDVCKYFSFLGKACQSLGWAKSTLSAVQLYIN